MEPSLDPSRTSTVLALLGPTNTGKTHRAIERMLEHDTGMIGLPLRLLSREVYDRVSAKIGEQAVALVTGEEKRVGARARYWVCTVEAMPLDLEVDFLAIDEIQLSSHPERGHVFTDRLLHARGRRETWFLGSATMERLVRTHLPTARIKKLERMSQLRHAGVSSLRTLPKRSAVVTFSMPHVYELADALRVRRGGAAVVLGALSPRVRNAQVALYQAGEVDFLVATDAIGMGLNLDVDHVALASRTKFDGFEVRDLEPQEMAQIVGRAGRHLRDGTFGTLAPEPELSPRLAAALEAHHFSAQRFLYYRNTALDFSTVAGLLNSLTARPVARGTMTLAPEGDDISVLRVLEKRPDLARLLTTAERVETLWDLCRIPNYEKRIPEHQADFLWPMIVEVLEHGRISARQMRCALEKLERAGGDIDDLMSRLSAVRTYTYVSQKAHWVEEADVFQHWSRTLEDRLSDALHERLLARFVERGEKASRRRERTGEVPRDRHHPFARLVELTAEPTLDESSGRAGAWVERLIDARTEEITLSPHGELWFESERVARLVAGQHLLRPNVQLKLARELDAGSRERIDRRLRAHARDVVAHLLAPLELEQEREHAPLRGLLYQLRQGMGTIDKRAARGQLEMLDDAHRAVLHEAGVVVDSLTVHSQPMLDDARRRTREALWRAFFGGTLDALSTRRFLVLPSGIERSALYALGFVPLRSHAVRCDVVSVLERLRGGAVPPELEARTLAELELSAETLPILLAELPRTRRRRRR